MSEPQRGHEVDHEFHVRRHGSHRLPAFVPNANAVPEMTPACPYQEFSRYFAFRLDTSTEEPSRGAVTFVPSAKSNPVQPLGRVTEVIYLTPGLVGGAQYSAAQNVAALRAIDDGVKDPGLFVVIPERILPYRAVAAVRRPFACAAVLLLARPSDGPVVPL